MNAKYEKVRKSFDPDKSERNHLRNNTPSSLHTKLLKKSRHNNSSVADVSIRVKQSTTKNAHDGDAESSAEDLRRVTDCHAT